MPRGIDLVRSSLATVAIPGRADAFRFVVSAANPENMPDKIFVHRKTLADATTEDTLEELCFVASPYDVVSFPADAPQEGQLPGYYRKNTIDVILESSASCEELWESIIADVSDLVAAYNRLDVFTPTATVHIGD